MLTPSGCLVADPPLYEEPPRTPPVFDLAQADPPISRPVVVDTTSSEPLVFAVPFRSEDRGEILFASLHLDYNILRVGSSFTGVEREFAASTFDDLGRTMSLPWDLFGGVPAGCHTLTLLASHVSTWETSEFRPNPITGVDDSARVVWWLNVDPPEDEVDTLRDCPTPSTGPT